MRKHYLFYSLIFVLIFNTGLLYAAPLENTLTSTPPQENVLKKWRLAFAMPSDKWVLVDANQDSNMPQAFITYQREAILDSKGIAVIPNIAFLYEKLDQEMDVVTFSKEMRFRMGEKFGKIKKVFVRDDEPQLISLKHAIGYICEGKDSKGMDHTLIWIHSVNERVGLQVIMDVSTEVYPAVKGEFEAILRSLRDV